METSKVKGSPRVGNSYCDRVRARFSPERAIRAQRALRRKLVLEDDYGVIRTVIGLDVAYFHHDGVEYGIGVAAALSYPSASLEYCVAYVTRVCVPYIPGLLAFREMVVLAPALLRILSTQNADLVVVDGHGIAHPRGLGIASHIGVTFQAPSIGVAKKKLFGREALVDNRKVVVNDAGEPIAVVIDSGRKSRIYVSPGHRVSLWSAARLVKSMLKKGRRLPEPTRVADLITKEVRRKLSRGPVREGFYPGCMLQ